MIVVDASAAVHVLAVEPPGGPAHRLLAAAGELHAPHLLELEVLSALRRLATGGALPPRAAAICMRDLQALPLSLWPHTPLLERAWHLRDNATVYDAAYLALAEQLDAPLVTADRALADCPRRRCDVTLITG